MKSSVELEKFWTGIADVTSEDFPENVKGAVYRVLTYTDDCDSFLVKVKSVLSASGDTLILIEEPERLSDFVKHDWVYKDHEIFEMMITADKSRADVVCGEAEYYSSDDA